MTMGVVDSGIAADSGIAENDGGAVVVTAATGISMAEIMVTSAFSADAESVGAEL